MEAQFSDGTGDVYDAVVGTDGFPSGVQELIWGPSTQYERFLGYYVCCGVIENFLGRTDTFIARQTPGRQAAVYAIGEGKLATFFIFKSGKQCRLTRHDQQTVLEKEFGDFGWEIPRVLEAMRSARQFYYDAVSQIEIDAWRKGRIALVGDASQCLTLLAGQGASMAMAGAYLLAAELERSGGNCEQAFAAYEAMMKPEIEKRQLQARKFA